MTNQLDLKLLRTINAICQAGSVTRAAVVLGITPGAVSYLVNKARKITGSALFFRTRNGLEPDLQALELSARYESIAGEIENQANIPGETRPIAISAYSLAEFLLSLAIVNDQNSYPEIMFHRQQYDENERLIKLRNREIDLDIGTRLPSDSSIKQLRFIVGKAGVLARKNHSTVHHRVSLMDWESHPHAVWQRGMHFISDDFERMHRFDTLTQKRNITFTSSTSLNLINLCATTDTLILIPERVGHKLEAVMPVKWLPAPEELEMQYICYLHYHRAMSGNQNMKNLISLFHLSFDV